MKSGLGKWTSRATARNEGYPLFRSKQASGRDPQGVKTRSFGGQNTMVKWSKHDDSGSSYACRLAQKWAFKERGPQPEGTAFRGD